jgi:hypothetical protein
MFQSVKDLARKIYDHDFGVHVLLADAAMSITNGFLDVFGYLDKRIVCWAHVERKIRENLVGITKDNKKKIKADLEAIHLATSNFAEIPSIDTHQLTLAFEWVKLNKRIVKLNKNDQVLDMFTSTEASGEANKNMSKSDLENNEWSTFDDYISSIQSIRYFTLYESKWELSICSCPYWNKNLFCKHRIGVAYNLNLTQFPGLNLNIEANAKSGRRKHAQEALIRRVSTGPVNPLMLTQEVIVAPTDPSINTTLLAIQSQNTQLNENIAPTGSYITIERISEAPITRKRGRPRKKTPKHC